MAGESAVLVDDGLPPMAGTLASAKRSRRLSGSASAPSLPGFPGRPPTPCKGSPSTSPLVRSPDASPLSRSPAASPPAGGRSMEAFCMASPLSPGSLNTTPRTPRGVEVSVEGQKVAVPAGAWEEDGQLRASLAGAVCTVTVKAGLSGRSGINVVLRVALVPREESLHFARTPEALSSWATVAVSGVEECDIGQLPSRSSGSPRIPKPGYCEHRWDETKSGGGRSPGHSPGRESLVSVTDALALGPGSCRAEFHGRLTLRAQASCSVLEGGGAVVRVEVEGELSLRPWFQLEGRDLVLNMYSEARDFFRTGEDLKALQKCEEALAAADSLNPRPPEMGEVFNLLGAVHLRRNAPALAVKCLDRALAIRGRHSQDDRTVATTVYTLGNAHNALGDSAQALVCHKRAVELLERTASAEDAMLASALHSLGGTHRVLGHFSEARHCYERALDIRQRTLGQEHPLNATTLNNLGAVLQQLTCYREAIACYQLSLAIVTRVYGADHEATAATLSNLGSAHTLVGEHQVAVDCHSHALAVREGRHGPEHAGVAVCLHNLGNALAAANRGQDAARCFWRALDIWSRALGPAHPDIGATLHCLGNVYRGLGETEAAAKCFEGALRIREVALGPTHAETARTRHCAALVGCRLGDRPGATQELQAALNSLISSLGSRHPWSLQARADLEPLLHATAR